MRSAHLSLMAMAAFLAVGCGSEDDRQLRAIADRTITKIQSRMTPPGVTIKGWKIDNIDVQEGGNGEKNATVAITALWTSGDSSSHTLRASYDKQTKQWDSIDELFSDLFHR